MTRKKTPEPEPFPVLPEAYSESPAISAVDLADRRAALEAIASRLAAETDDVLWGKHKSECRCVCGMADGRLLVAIVKELRATLAELETLPSAKEESASDDLAKRRADRLAESAG